MAPKKPPVVDDNYWRTQIEQAPLNEPSWPIKVFIFESAGSDQDRIYLDKFEVFAAEERRFVIKNICRTETIFMVNQLGGDKKVKDDNLRVFEEGQAFLKDKKDIPTEIIALIIKHLILKIKEEYIFIKRQRLEVKQGMRLESATMLSRNEVRETLSFVPPAEPEPTPRKGKGKKVEEPVTQPEPPAGKKYNTLLRVRGEEWRDKVYVDDFPVDGPNLYIAITGFVDPFLATCLIKIGIPLTAVVQVRIDPTVVVIPSSLFRQTKRGQSHSEILSEKSLRFWEELQNSRINKETADYLKNTAFVIFSPPYWDQENLSGEPNKIYDELCFLMYDLQDLTRQHIHYLDNLEVFEIPEDLIDDQYKKYYDIKMDDLNLECVTTYSVMDSILQAICKHQEEQRSITPSVTEVETANELSKSEKAEKLIKSVFETLCKPNIGKKSYRVTFGEEYENYKNPIVINYGDFAKYTTFHLPNLNLDNVIHSSLLGMPVNKLRDKQDRPEGELETKINFHVNVLLSCFDRKDIETSELERLIHILACRKLFNNRSSLKKDQIPLTTVTEFKKVYLKRSTLAVPLPKCPSLIRTGSYSSPTKVKSESNSHLSTTEETDRDSESSRIKVLFDCPDISELVSAAEIASDKPINHMIDEYDYVEDFNGINALQIVTEAFNKFNCIDYKYCEVTDGFIMLFYNNHDKDGISREEWRYHLPTPVCLQDFFDFVLEEHYDWIQSEEEDYENKHSINTKAVSKNQVNLTSVPTCLDAIDVEMDLLIEGSLKHKNLPPVADEENNSTDRLVYNTTASYSPSTTEIGSKIARKSTNKNPIKSAVSLGRSVANFTTEPTPKPKPFSGYDLSDRRVEVIGRDSSFFSRDGTKVLSCYSLLIPANLEYITLSVVPGNGTNEFWMHKALGDNISPEIIDTCESFRIITKDLASIYIKKNNYKMPMVTVSNSNTTAQKVLTNNVTENLETRSFHSLYLTWPNGLVTESIHENNSPSISHIKQYYINPLPELNEIKRCISLNGDVIIFKTSGDIEILRPNSSYILITKYERKVVVPDVPEEPVIENIPDKLSKGKSPKKDKPKVSKSPSKTSKSNTEDDKLEQDKVNVENADCKLVIERFEYINTNGMRQLWVNDIPFDIGMLLIRTATDYNLGEVYSRRMDGTNILLNKDGVQIVTFPNKTRIICKCYEEADEIFPEWTAEELEYLEQFEYNVATAESPKSDSTLHKSSIASGNNKSNSSFSKKLEEEEKKEREKSDGYISVQLTYSIEHCNFTTVTIEKAEKKIFIDSPNNTTVVIDFNNHYEMTLDSSTSAKFDGNNLLVTYEACDECSSYTSCTIKIKADTNLSVPKIDREWLRMKDSFCKKIIVNEEGAIVLLEEPCSQENIRHVDDAAEDKMEDKCADSKSEMSFTNHGKCRELYSANSLRFFILRRDLSCAELIHRALVDQYRQACRWQPWCSINHYDTFGDHRRIVSLLTPVQLMETEKWLMDSKLADKPKYLTFQDLKKDPGKGFYHWMRPFKRFEPKPMKPDNVLPPRLPKAFILRTLELQWTEVVRNKLKGGKELIKAILKYRKVVETDCEDILRVPIIDPRTDDERRTDAIIQSIAQKTYDELRAKLAEDLQRRAKATITTRPLDVPEQMTTEGEFEEESSVEPQSADEKREQLLEQMNQAETMSPNLRKYWRRRAEEYKEEQFYLHLLRDGSVPPYFKNILAGAIWWEVNDMAGRAVLRAENRDMFKCHCQGEHSEDDLDTFISHSTHL